MGRTSVPHKRHCRKYKCPNGRCIHELAAGKTADCWKDSTHASRSSSSSSQVQRFYRHAYNSPKPAVAVPQDDKDPEKNARRVRRKEEENMEDVQKAIALLTGLTQDDWRQYHSDMDVQEIARIALKVLKEYASRLERESNVANYKPLPPWIYEEMARERRL